MSDEFSLQFDGVPLLIMDVDLMRCFIFASDSDVHISPKTGNLHTPFLLNLIKYRFPGTCHLLVGRRVLILLSGISAIEQLVHTASLMYLVLLSKHLPQMMNLQEILRSKYL
ncbi:MAG TPA: hypothetical protein O0X64_00325 [Methanocorpusculum sp.]|nr:hypothetical protein [Methanocorpusculum sp.]